MGKKLIIQGADFSANGFIKDLDITSILADELLVHRSISTINGHVNTTPSNIRCCIEGIYFTSLGINTTPYTKLHIKLKPIYNYVFSMGPNINSPTNWKRWDGTATYTDFAWATVSPTEAIATFDANCLALALNFRYADNVTEFPIGTVLTDIVEYIRLEE